MAFTTIRLRRDSSTRWSYVPGCTSQQIAELCVPAFTSMLYQVQSAAM